MNSLARQTSVRTTFMPPPIAGDAGPGFVPVEMGCTATGGVHCPLLCLSWMVGSVDKSLPSAEGSTRGRAEPCTRPSSGAPRGPRLPARSTLAGGWRGRDVHTSRPDPCPCPWFLHCPQRPQGDLSPGGWRGGTQVPEWLQAQLCKRRIHPQLLGH